MRAALPVAFLAVLLTGFTPEDEALDPTTLPGAVVVPPVAIPLAYLVVRKLRREGGRGTGVAHAAIVVAYLVMLVMALLGLNLLVALLISRG